MTASGLRPVLLAGLRDLGLSLSDVQVDQLLAYQELIAKWNKVYNLTAVRDPREMLTHHLLDSLAAIPPLLRQTGCQPGFAAGLPQGEAAPLGGSGGAGESNCPVTPAEAGVHSDRAAVSTVAVDSRFRGSDGNSSDGAWGLQDRSAGPPQGESGPLVGSGGAGESTCHVTPAEAGVHSDRAAVSAVAVDSRFRGSDGNSSGGARGLRLLDVGSGGGLPGVVIAITCPQIEVHCVDTVLKKATFIQQVAASLKLPNLRGIHARVESLKAGHDGQGEGGYDVVCSRAFASLADFTTWSRSALKSGAVWMAMKGKHPSDELAALPPEVSVFHVEQLSVPGLGAERCIVWMRLA